MAELPGLIAEHPYRERLHGVLILSLYRSGREADALAAYRAARARLVEDLGLEPGLDLQRLETAILRQDPALAHDERVAADGEEIAHELGAAGNGDDCLARAPQRPRPTSGKRRRRSQSIAGLAAVTVIATAAAVLLLARGGDEPPLRMTSGDLGFIDAATGRLARVLPAGQHGGPLAVADGSAWVADQAAKTVTAYPPALSASSYHSGSSAYRHEHESRPVRRSLAGRTFVTGLA